MPKRINLRKKKRQSTLMVFVIALLFVFALSTSVFAKVLNLGTPSDSVYVQGNLGVGTSAPTAKLNVSGDAKIDNWYYKDNAFCHTDAGYATHVYYVLLADETNNDKIFGQVSGYRGGATAGPRASFAEFAIDTSSAYTTGAALTRMWNQSTGAGVSLAKVTYNGHNWWALKLNSGASWHAQCYDFVGVRVISDTTDWMKTVRDDDVNLTAVLETRDYRSLDYRLFVDNANNVGINTATPTQKLHVNGGAQLDSISYGVTPGETQTLALSTVEYVNSKVGGSGGIASGTTGQTLRHNGTGWIANSLLYNNGTNVGIGTSAPGSKLDVSSNGGIVGRFVQNSGWTGSEWALYVTGYSNLGGYRINAADGIRGIHKISSGGILGFSTQGDDPITFTQSASLERVRIAPGGNVGINNTNPGYKLDITSSVINEKSFRLSHPTAPDAAGFTLGFGNTFGSNDNAIVGSVEYSSTDYDVFSINRANRNFVLLGGNTGIGTTNPIQKLHVNGGAQLDAISFGTTPGESQALALTTVEYVNAKVGGSGGIASGTSGQTLRHDGTSWVANSLLYNNGTSIGIGYTNPARDLILAESDSGDAVMQFQNSTTGYTAVDGLYLGIDANEVAAIWNYENTGMDFGTNNSSRLFIASDGNVGIGTTVPGAKLDVNGVTRAYRGDELGWTNFAQTFSYDGTVHHYWNRIFQISDNSGSINFQVLLKGDVNYSKHQLYLVTVSKYNGTAISISVDKVSGTNDVPLYVAVDDSGYIWVKGDIEWTSYAAYKILYNYNTIVLSSITTQEAQPTNSVYNTVSEYARYSFPGLVQQSQSGFNDIYMNSVGNVGINTTSPTQKLHVAGVAQLDSISFGVTPGSGQSLALATVEYVNNSVSASGGLWSDNGTSIYYNSGNVGIGTSAPSGNFDIVNASQIFLGGASATLRLTSTANTMWLQGLNATRTGTVNNIAFSGSSGANRTLDIDLANQRVGIGNSAPAYNLDVTGTFRVTDAAYFDRTTFIKDSNGTVDSWWGWYAWDKEFQFNKRSSTNTFVQNIFTANWDTGNFNLVPTSGNVGVYRATPTAKLDVNGSFISTSATISGLGGSGNTFVMSDNSGNLYTQDGITFKRTAVADASYNAQAGDYIIAYTSLTADRTVTLPTSVCTSGRAYIVVNETGGSYNVVVDPEGAATISGMANISLPAYNSIPVYCNGTNWFIY